MKRYLFIYTLLWLCSFSAFAQYDDMYIVPSKKSNQQKSRPTNIPERYEDDYSNYDNDAEAMNHSGSMRDVDEYNRRGRGSYADVKSSQSDSVLVSREDYENSMKMKRFEGYNNITLMVGSPWYYDPWYYDSWYWHTRWHDPWHYSYSYYDPWYWGSGWHGYWGGYYGGIHWSHGWHHHAYWNRPIHFVIGGGRPVYNTRRVAHGVNLAGGTRQVQSRSTRRTTLGSRSSQTNSTQYRSPNSRSTKQYNSSSNNYNNSRSYNSFSNNSSNNYNNSSSFSNSNSGSSFSRSSSGGSSTRVGGGGGGSRFGGRR